MWRSWIEAAEVCGSCDLALNRHQGLLAMWIETWITIVAVMAWIIPALIYTGGAGPAWVTGGAVAIAIVIPTVSYRYAQAMARRLLFRLDPPRPGGAHR